MPGVSYLLDSKRYLILIAAEATENSKLHPYSKEKPLLQIRTQGFCHALILTTAPLLLISTKRFLFLTIPSYC